MRIDVEMPFDRVRLTTGHRTILAARTRDTRRPAGEQLLLTS
jgi:hypothetical protein